jgi:predicted RNA-binding protein YlxR (DUF448 family)
LVRIVRQPAGDVVIDATGRLNGRGAYLCNRPACWVRASETETLAKALNAHIPDNLRMVLRERAQAMVRMEAEHSDEKERSTTDVE